MNLPLKYWRILWPTFWFRPKWSGPNSIYFPITMYENKIWILGRPSKSKLHIIKYSTQLTIHILDTSVSKYSFGHLTLLYPMACITQIYILKSLLNVSPNREPFHDQNTLALMRSLSTHYIYLIFLLLKWFIKMYNNVTLEEN